MRTQAIGCLAFALLLSTRVGAQEQTFSGPRPGEKIMPFKVLEVTGPADVKEVTFVDLKKKGTTLLVFLHKISEPAIGLMIPLEWYAHKQIGLTSHFVLLAEDQEKTEQQVKRWWRRPFFSGSPLSISLDGAEGPGIYGLNRNVMMTVLIAKDNTVTSNFALKAPNRTDAPKILAKLADAMGQPVPSFEKIQAELRIERNRRREMRTRQNPVFKLAPNEDLGRLMIRMLFQEGSSAEYVNGVAKEMSKWASDEAEKKAAIATYCRAVLDGDFEINRYAREALQRLSGKQ